MTRLAMFAVAQVAGPLDVRVIDLGSGASFPRRVTDAPRRLFDFDECSDPMIQNLSASPIAIGIEAGLAFAQGFLIPARFMWSRFGLTQIDATTIPNNPVPSSSLAFWDRNPLPVKLVFEAAGIPPHGADLNGVQRWSYNPPASRRALVQWVHLYVGRNSSGGWNSGVNQQSGRFAHATIQMLEGGGIFEVLARAEILTDRIGDVGQVDLAPGTLLRASDTLRGFTGEHQATLGTVSYQCIAWLTEFDA